MEVARVICKYMGSTWWRIISCFSKLQGVASGFLDSDRANTGEAASTWNFLNLGPSVLSRLLLTMFISLCRCSCFAEMMMMGRWFQGKRTQEDIVNLEKKH